MGLVGFSLVTKPIATCFHYLTRKENIEMRAEVGFSLLISLVMKIPHKVRDQEEENPHISEVTYRTDQNAKLPNNEGYSVHLVDTLFHV